MAAYGVELIDVTKRFGGTTAVEDLSLEVRPGEFLFVLGPSGCGKSTTLRVIGGLEEPTEGIIKIGDEVVNDVPPYKRDVAMVFQTWALFPHKTVFENIEFGLRMRGVRKKDREKRVAQYLELVRLSGYEKKMPTEMSGGEQQRVALARSLIVEPKVLLLDEPLSNLDLRLRQQMRVEISQIQKELGVTTIFVTHDQTEALTMGDRIALMNRGLIEQVGTPIELYESPRTEFAAQFVGETNFFQGVVSSIDGVKANVVTKSGLSLRIEDNVPGLTEGSKISISIRPDRVRICTGDSQRQEGNTYTGRIYLKAYLGTHVRYHIQLDDENKIFVDTPAMPGEPEYAVGDEVEVSWDADNGMCFPSKA